MLRCLGLNVFLDGDDDDHHHEQSGHGEDLDDDDQRQKANRDDDDGYRERFWLAKLAAAEWSAESENRPQLEVPMIRHTFKT